MKVRVNLYISEKAAKKLRITVMKTGIKPSQLFEEMIEIEARAAEKIQKIKDEAAKRLEEEEEKAFDEFVDERFDDLNGRE